MRSYKAIPGCARQSETAALRAVNEVTYLQCIMDSWGKSCFVALSHQTKCTEETSILENIPHLKLLNVTLLLDPPLALVGLDTHWPGIVWAKFMLPGHITWQKMTEQQRPLFSECCALCTLPVPSFWVTEPVTVVSVSFSCSISLDLPVFSCRLPLLFLRRLYFCSKHFV